MSQPDHAKCLVPETCWLASTLRKHLPSEIWWQESGHILFLCHLRLCLYIYIWFRFFRRFKGVGIYWPSLMSLESWKIGDWQRMIYIVLIDLDFKPQTTCFLQILCALQWHWSRIDHWSQFFFKGRVFFCCLLKTEIHWCTIRDDENQTWLVLIWCFYTLTGHTIPSMARTV